MKHTKTKSLLICIGLLVLCGFASQDNFTNLKGPYFGQSPPANKPIMFAPEFFNKEVHSCPIFSPDGMEVYWDLMEEGKGTLFMNCKSGKWTKPKTVPYASRFGAYDPCFSPDGKKVFFTSNEATSGGKKNDKENIWYVEKTASGWSTRKPLPASVNSHGLHWQISVAANGNLYFGNNMDILCAQQVDGEYAKVEELGDSINSEFFEGTPFVAHDESYILFSRYGGDLRYADLFICFKKTDGSWSDAQNMGETVNTKVHELCPQVTRDRKYLFFIRNDEKGELRPFWMSAKIIENLQHSILK